MTPNTDYKVTRDGKVVLTGSYVVCRQEADANGGRVSRTIKWEPGIECEHGYDACPICDK